MIAIVVSRADEASTHIGEHLLDLAEWTEREDDARPDGDGGGTYYTTDGFELRTFDDLHIYLDDPAAAFDGADLLVFVSRHSGDTGPLLTAHFTGNFGPAEYGGAAGEFARAAPSAQSLVVDRLAARAPDEYDVGIECTHHGPTGVAVPSMFVELGSGEPEWRDAAAARAVARAVLDVEGADADRERQVVGLGGGHYAPRFTRIVRETDWAVGHVGADWALDAMGAPTENRAVLERALTESAADVAVIDGEDEDLRAALADLDCRVVSETWIRETDGVDLDLVGSLEAALTGVDDGLRFGAAASDGTTDGEATEFEVHSLPSALVTEAWGVDGTATREAVADHALAFETSEGGTRPAGRVAVAGDAYDAVVDALAAVLEEKYETVERREDAVVARTVGFDPAKARTLGIPEGPAFGRLADGEAVDVDGERIDPSTVESERVERFPV